MSKSRNEILKEYAATKKGSDIYYRESWECDYFSLNGKCFGMMNEKLITLKGKPEDNIILRENNSDVTPGYYTNKVHWNSIDIKTKQLNDDELKKLIDISYELVLKNLTKKERDKILKEE